MEHLENVITFFFSMKLWAFYYQDDQEYINKDTHTQRFIRLPMPFQLQVCLKEELTKSEIQSAIKVLGEFHRLTKTTEASSFL